MGSLSKGALLLSLLYCWSCCIKPSNFNARPPDHTIWDGFLQKHLTNGQIATAAILEDSTQLRFYLTYLSRRHPNDAWNGPNQLAYWINLHNALFLAQKFAPATLSQLQNKAGKFVIEGKPYTLRGMRKKALHNPLHEGRSLFALYSNQTQAPSFPNRALLAEGWNQQLENLSKTYLNDPVFNQIEPGKVVLSPFFRQNQRYLRPLRAFVLENSNTQLSPNFRLKFRKPKEW